MNKIKIIVFGDGLQAGEPIFEQIKEVSEGGKVIQEFKSPCLEGRDGCRDREREWPNCSDECRRFNGSPERM